MPYGISHRRVADYSQWKRGWDELVAIREEKGGVQSEQIFRNPDDPSEVVVLRAVVDHLMSQERLPTREVLLNDLLSLMACHAAVRAGDPLTPEEIAALVAQRQLADDTHHCPHGRPTALLFSKHDLDRQFRRV